MKTKTKLNSLASFCEASHLNHSLIHAVVRQMGGWQSFTECAADIANRGIHSGFNGFNCYGETETFVMRNRKLIADLASEQANDFGTGVFEMIRGFGCFRHGRKPNDEEIGSAIYAGRNLPDGVNMLNALAWYAGEEVARSYVDLMESQA